MLPPPQFLPVLPALAVSLLPPPSPPVFGSPGLAASVSASVLFRTLSALSLEFLAYSPSSSAPLSLSVPPTPSLPSPLGCSLILARPRRSLPPPNSRPSLPFDFGFGTTTGASSVAGSTFFVRSSTLYLLRLFPAPPSLHPPLLS